MKLEIHDQAPSTQLVADAVQEVTVVDDKGRQLIIRRPGVLAQFKLVKALGPELAENGRYVAMCTRLTFLVSIDGVPIALRNDKQIEGVIQMLERDGFKALDEAIEANFSPKPPEEAREELKK